MPSDLVIITGSAGQIGFKVLADTLKLGIFIFTLSLYSSAMS